MNLTSLGYRFPNSFESSSNIITGGLGFIGSNLTSSFAESSSHVTVIDSLNPSYGGNLYNLEPWFDDNRVCVNISDVRDEHSLKVLLGGATVLFNLAGQTSHMDSMSDPFTDLDINARAQLSLLEVCRKVAPDIRIILPLHGKYMAVLCPFLLTRITRFNQSMLMELIN